MKQIITFFITLLLSCTTIFAQFSIQKSVIEEFTGAWCGFCPDGALILEDIVEDYPNAIPVSIHTGDAMTDIVGDSIADFFTSTFPSATFNRNGQAVGRGSWSSAVVSSLNGASPVTLSYDSIGFDGLTRTVTVKVKARFTGPVTGDIRANLYIVEDNISGLGQGYDQSNYDNATQGHPYQGAGDPIVGYMHRHVFRKAAGGVIGIPGLFPSSVNFGTEVTFKIGMALDPSYDLGEIYLVAMVSNVTGSGPSQRRILNGEGIHMATNITPLGPPTSIDEDKLAKEVKVYPNPFSDQVQFTFDLQNNGWIESGIYDLQGRKIANLGAGIANQGLQSLSWNGQDDAGKPVANGLYIFRLNSDKEILSRRIMLNR